LLIANSFKVTTKRAALASFGIAILLAACSFAVDQYYGMHLHKPAPLPLMLVFYGGMMVNLLFGGNVHNPNAVWFSVDCVAVVFLPCFALFWFIGRVRKGRSTGTE
jgi:hypothetical protein